MPPALRERNDKRKVEALEALTSTKSVVKSKTKKPVDSTPTAFVATGTVEEQLAQLEGQLEPLSEPWPARALEYKCWRGLGSNSELAPDVAKALKNERDSLLMDVLEQRGWTDGGNPCDPRDMKELPQIVSGTHPTDKLPRRAFYVCGDDAEARVLHDLPGNGSQYRVSGFPGAEPACYKTSVCKCLGGMPFVPETYVLPGESEALISAAAKDRKAKKPSFWLGKPRNECTRAQPATTLPPRPCVRVGFFHSLPLNAWLAFVSRCVRVLLVLAFAQTRAAASPSSRAAPSSSSRPPPRPSSAWCSATSPTRC